MGPRLSVFIITRNEEKKIRRCLESVRWADEIVVVDSGSRDRTLSVCREFTDKVSSREFRDYADQKNHALSLTTGDWALSLDADEEMTPPLKEEILSVTGSAQAHDAYRIARRSRIFGRWMRFTGTQHDRPIRLWKKGRAHFEQPVHEMVRVQGTTGCLKNRLLHYTYDSLKDYMERLNRYTTMEAGLLKPGGSGISWKPAAMFLKLYFWEKGFADGPQGFFFSVLSAFYVFMKHAKSWELSRRTAS